MGFGYAVYFTERARNRVIRWDPDSGDTDVIAGEPKDADPTQRLRDPYGLAFDHQGALVIGDKQNNRLCRLKSGRLGNVVLRDADGHRSRKPNSPAGYDPADFSAPTSLFREADGSLLCTFCEDHTIYRIHHDGRLELVLGVLRSRPHAIGAPPEVVPPTEVMNVPLNLPTGVVKRADGTYFFIERNPQIVRQYHPRTGLRCVFPLSIIRQWSRKNEAPAHGRITEYHPSFPATLALDGKDMLYLCEPVHGCVLELDVKAGTFRRVISIARTPQNDGQGPNAIAFGPDGTAWVADAAAGGLEAYSPKATGEWARTGTTLTKVAGKPVVIGLGGVGLVTGK